MATASTLKNHPDISARDTVALPASQRWHGCATSPDVSSFEKTYKTAYSHGLEKIYQLENIDIKSVRRISESIADNIVDGIEEIEWLSNAEDVIQLEFDFGTGFKTSREHFVNREPIQVLALSKHAEKCLLERGVRVIKDLLEADLREFVFIKGLGQGHIDDIQRKLAGYIQGKSLKDAKQLDFASWLRTLVADSDLKKVCALLEPFGLSDLFTLSPSENVEVRRLSSEKRQEWSRDIRNKLLHDDKIRQLHEDMQDVAEVFIKPWMRGRFGLATEVEILERVLNLSEKPEEGRAVLEFFRVYYFNDKFPFSEFLKVVDDGLLCVDAQAAQIYRDIVEKVKTYFYKRDVRYSLEQLRGFIDCEFASDWCGFSEGCVERILRICPDFRVRKDQTGKLIVKLS